MITAGILSDTHTYTITKEFMGLLDRAFSDCEMIFHAGDICNHEVLNLFGSRIVHAVHGNMCDLQTQKQLPHHKIIEVEGNLIGLCHGAGPRHNIEDRMWGLFPEADCIIYGHTHQPVCKKMGGTLIINPGSFQCSSPHGAPASYAILTISEAGMSAKLKSISLTK